MTQHWEMLVSWVGPSSDDVVQEAFIRLATQEPRPENSLAWLMTVTRRLAINQHASETSRHQRERAFALPTNPTSHSSNGFTRDVANGGVILASAEAAELRLLVSQLAEMKRRVLVAKLWADLSWDDIADSLGCSRSTVWRTYRAAIAELKTIYEQA
ncbi:MAG: sigma-70 family RNA polymerase sigma factor [Planctomycetota bacterium]